MKHHPAEALPGDLAIWIFIVAELLVFGIFFMAYAFARSQQVELFNLSQASLVREFGAVNTLLLITGSYAVVNAVQAIKRDQVSACGFWLKMTLLLGGLFCAIKLLEFYQKLSEGISLSTNTFYMFYLSLTFFHFMHVLLGMVILAAVWFKSTQGAYSARQYTGVETGAAYWHMVDLVWIVLFPLVYVIH